MDGNQRYVWIYRVDNIRERLTFQAIIYYAPTIFDQIGLSGGTIPLLATGVVGIVNFVFTIPAVLFVDNVSFILELCSSPR